MFRGFEFLSPVLFCSLHLYPFPTLCSCLLFHTELCKCLVLLCMLQPVRESWRSRLLHAQHVTVCSASPTAWETLSLDFGAASTHGSGSLSLLSHIPGSLGFYFLSPKHLFFQLFHSMLLPALPCAAALFCRFLRSTFFRLQCMGFASLQLPAQFGHC